MLSCRHETAAAAAAAAAASLPASFHTMPNQTLWLAYVKHRSGLQFTVQLDVVLPNPIEIFELQSTSQAACSDCTAHTGPLSVSLQWLPGSCFWAL